MHKKNNNKTKSFIQGLRPFSSIIPSKIKKNLKKMVTILQALLIIGQE